MRALHFRRLTPPRGKPEKQKGRTPKGPWTLRGAT